MEKDNELIEYWAKKFPFGIEEFVRGLSNEKRLAIASLLMEKNKLRFSQIKKELNLDSNALSQHLKKLLNYGLVRRTKSVWKEDEEIFKSFYELSPIYRKLLDSNIELLKYPILKRSFTLVEPIIIPKEEFADKIEVIGIDIDRESKRLEALIKYSKKIDIGGESIWEKEKRTVGI